MKEELMSLYLDILKHGYKISQEGNAVFIVKSYVKFIGFYPCTMPLYCKYTFDLDTGEISYSQSVI